MAWLQSMPSQAWSYLSTVFGMGGLLFLCTRMLPALLETCLVQQPMGEIYISIGEDSYLITSFCFGIQSTLQQLFSSPLPNWIAEAWNMYIYEWFKTYLSASPPHVGSHLPNRYRSRSKEHNNTSDLFCVSDNNLLCNYTNSSKQKYLMRDVKSLIAIN